MPKAKKLAGCLPRCGRRRCEVPGPSSRGGTNVAVPDTHRKPTGRTPSPPRSLRNPLLVRALRGRKIPLRSRTADPRARCCVQYGKRGRKGKQTVRCSVLPSFSHYLSFRRGRMIGKRMAPLMKRAGDAPTPGAASTRAAHFPVFSLLAIVPPSTSQVSLAARRGKGGRGAWTPIRWPRPTQRDPLRVGDSAGFQTLCRMLMCREVDAQDRKSESLQSSVHTHTHTRTHTGL